MNLVEILITAKDMTEPAFEGAKTKSEGLAGTMSKMGAVAGAALVGIGVESVKMAAEYESSTVRLVTSAGEQNKNLDMVRKGMLQMSGQVGVSADDLSKAMYYVEAAGYHAADGLKVLKAAAQGAAAEGADTTDVAKALTDVLKDYHMSASSAADVTSKMITAVAHGKVNLEDYSKAFANIVPAAAAAGISFNDVGAALSEMTNHGFTAARASQNLAQALRSLLNPTGPMKKAFDEFGVSVDVLRQKLHGPNGLTDAMQYLSQAATKAGKEGTPEFAAALKLLMGTAPGANAALSTVGANMADTTATIQAMGSATADASGQVQGFAEVQKTAAFQWKALQATFDAFMITLGEKLLPYLNELMHLFTDHQGTLNTVLNWGIKILAVFALYKAAVEAITLVTKAWAVAQAILNLDLDANPIGILAAVLVALSIAFYEAWQHSETFRRAVLGLAQIFGGEFLHAIMAALPGMKAMFDMFMGMMGGIAHGLAAVLGIIPGVGSAAKAAAATMDKLKSAGDAAFNGLYDMANKADAALTDATRERLLKMNISDAQAKIATAQKQLQGLPPSKQVNLLANIGVLQGKILDAQRQIDALHGKTVTITYNGVVEGYSGPGGTYTSTTGSSYAAGGVVSAAASGGARSGMVLVGERGPELVKLPSGSYVTPAGRTQQMLSAGGGAAPVVVEINAAGLDTALLTWLRNAVRVRGGNVQTALGQGY